VRLTLTALSPKAPQPGGTVIVGGVAQNTATLTVTNLRVLLRIDHQVVTSRSELAAFADGGDAVFGSRLDATAVSLPNPLGPGASLRFRISVPVAELGLARDGVYKFGVELRGDYGTEGDQAVGRLRTFLPFDPLGAPVRPTRLAWIWPLVDRPRRAAATSFLDDTLGALMRGGGRLAALLRAGFAAERLPERPGHLALPPSRAHPAGEPIVLPVHPVPVTWAIDPLLVEDAALMSRGYSVQPSGVAHPVRGAFPRVAAGFLRTLRAALQGADVLALPYADVDVAALAHAGASATIAGALGLGRSLLGSLAKASAESGVIWPPDGALDASTLAALVRLGTQTVVLDSTSMPPPHDPGYTPTARVALPDGRTDAVLTDDTLDAVVTSGAVAPGEAREAEQRFLAETLMITEELPETPRDVVVAPDRRWAPAAGYATALLADTGEVPWLAPVSLEQVRGDEVTTVPRDPLGYPPTAAQAELTPATVTAGQDYTSAATTFLAILTDRTRPTVQALGRAGYLLASSAWRGDPADASSLAAIATARLSRLHDLVAVVSSGTVVLTSRSGDVPFTIANGLDQPVNLLVRLDAGARARIEGNGTIAVVAPANSRHLFRVRAAARTAGSFALSITLFTPGDPPRPYDAQPTRLIVRSTVYATVALVITALATAVLFGAAAVRLALRAARAARSRTDLPRTDP